MRDKHYKVFAQRLSDENVAWLKELREEFSSWNKLFDYLREQYGQSKHNIKK